MAQAGAQQAFIRLRQGAEPCICPQRPEKRRVCRPGRRDLFAVQASVYKENRMGQIKKKRKSEYKRILFITLVLLLPLAQFCVFTLYTNVRTFVMAFQSPSSSGFALWSNLKVLQIEWTTTVMWKRAVVNSLGYFPASLITLFISVIVAYFLFKKVPLSGLYKVIFFFPSIISIVILGLAFKNMFSSTGPINSLLRSWFGVKNPPMWLNDPDITMYVLYLYAIWAGVGYNCILLFGALSRVPEEIHESADLDGCGMFREIFVIYVPIMWSTISTMLLFCVTTVFTMFLHTQVLTGGAGDTWTVVSIIMDKINGAYRDPNYAATLSLLLVIIGVPITQLAKWGFSKIFDTVEV